jgi:hypothetical protein
VRNYITGATEEEKQKALQKEAKDEGKDKKDPEEKKDDAKVRVNSCSWRVCCVFCVGFVSILNALHLCLPPQEEEEPSEDEAPAAQGAGDLDDDDSTTRSKKAKKEQAPAKVRSVRDSSAAGVCTSSGTSDPC